MLLALTDESGQSLVEDVTRTAASAQSVLCNPLPDLVVHWQDAAFASPLKIKGSRVQVEAISKKSTGQHRSEGFCIYRGSYDWCIDGAVAAKELGRLIIASLNRAILAPSLVSTRSERKSHAP